ncbi:hypothetical protein [Aeromicrobium sp.]|uniref:hypothetical protein n=1 Tax=Aeromicrobium sp. TaxID=1871063 RepID=UPI003D6C169C
MSNTNHSVNVQRESTSRTSIAALVLGVLSLPGSLLAWDTLPGGGFVWGLPLAIAAVVVGVKAVRDGATGRAAAFAGVFLGGAMIAMMVVWTAVGAG